MENIEIVKIAANVIVGAGTTTIVKSIIKEHVEPENAVQAITVASASMILGMMVKDMTKEYTSTKIDKFAAFVKKTKSQIDAKKNEGSTPEQ